MRKAIWFTFLSTGQPGDYVEAIYNRVDSNGTSDPLIGPKGGKPGHTYTVILLTGSKLLAPCPDFCNGGEAARLNDIDRALIRSHSKRR